MNTKKDAIDWIENQNTGYARTIREKAKYLAGKLNAYQAPHPAIWDQVLRIANGI